MKVTLITTRTICVYSCNIAQLVNICKQEILNFLLTLRIDVWKKHFIYKNAKFLISIFLVCSLI